MKIVRFQRHLPLTIQFYISGKITGVPPLQSDFYGLSSALKDNSITNNYSPSDRRNYTIEFLRSSKSEKASDEKCSPEPGPRAPLGAEGTTKRRVV